jgi:hypothetical protein
MRWLLVMLVGLQTAHADAPKLPGHYAALFTNGAKWTLAADRVDSERTHHKGTLACQVTAVATTGQTQRSRIICRLQDDAGDEDWGGVFPAGIYVATSKGLGHAGSIVNDDSELADMMKESTPGKPLIGVRPTASKRVSHSPVGDQRTTDVVVVRAFAGGWCYTEAGDFDSNEYTVCFDKRGLVGARFQKVGADGHYDFGKVPAAYTVR